ncbi:hypothetical protein ACNF49_40620 [Actinomadura sp. ATCC 39365]|uniref:hypothetical protein n=1 Tax=Nonomuraea sp. NPDC005692 TaxID=3157168 RepID=UPI0033E97059
MTSCLLALAAELGASATEIEEARTGRRDAADVLWRRLEERTGWLLVLDNADDPATLEVAGAGAAGCTTCHACPRTTGHAHCRTLQEQPAERVVPVVDRPAQPEQVVPEKPPSM